MPPRRTFIPASHQSSIDLKLASAALQTPRGPSLVPRNLAELSAVLKRRISSRQPQQNNSRGRTRQWLIGKGVNLQSMSDCLANSSTLSSTLRYAPHYSRGTTEPLLLQQTDFLDRQIQYQQNRQWGECRMMRSTKVRLHNQLIASIYPKEYQPIHKNMMPLPPPTASKNTKSIKKYVECLISLVKKSLSQQGKIQPKLWARMFADCVDWKIWRVLQKQLKGISKEMMKKTNSPIKKTMLANSLKVVEEELDNELPLNSETVSHFLSSKYLSQCRPGDYALHATHASLWGKAFLYFRAGRMKKCISIINSAGHSTVSRIIRQANQSIRIGQPRRLELPPLDERDIFYEQIGYAISGNCMYSSQLLSDPTTLDVVWILLRNSGVFYDQDCQEFQNLRQKLSLFYKQNQMNGHTLEYMTYLLDYDAIVGLNECEGMNRHDLIHLLIMLYRYPFLTQSASSISQRLTEYLSEYVLTVARQVPGTAFQYYLLQMPEDRIVNAGSNVLVSNNLYSRVEWAIFRQNLSHKTFGQLMYETTTKYVESSDRYYECAMKVVAYTEVYGAGIDLLATMLVQQIRDNRSYSDSQIRNSLWKMEEWIHFQEALIKQYSALYHFFSHSHRLTQLLIERNYDQIQKELQISEFTCIQNINDKMTRMLNKLKEIKAPDAYFIFLRQALTAAECLYSRNGRQYNLRQFRHQVLRSCQTVIKHDGFSDLGEEPAFKQLERHLNQVLLGSHFDRR